MSKRNQSVELLRCVLMFLVVLCHTFGHGVFKEVDLWWTLFFTALIHFHVDGFIAISGWYGIKFSFSKFMRLWGMFFFYTALSVAYSTIIRGEPITFDMCKVNGGWFGGAYMVLMFLAPFLNAGIERLVASGPRQAWECWGGGNDGLLVNDRSV